MVSTNTETPSNTGRQGGTRPLKGGRIQAHMWGDMGAKLGDQARQELGNLDAPSNTGSPQEGEPTIHRHACGETMKAMGDNESNGRHWEMVGDKGRQDPAQAVTPSNTGTHMWEDNGRQWETRPCEGGRSI